MNREEALRLCRIAKSISPAQAVDEYTPEAWALVLRNVRLVDAEQALEELGGEQEFIHCSHIVKRVKKIRNQRVLDFGTLPDPPASVDPDNQREHSRWLKATTEAIADGTYRRPEPQAIETRRDIRELGQAKSVESALAGRDAREAIQRARMELQAAAAEEKRAKDEKRAAREAARVADREARTNPTQPAAEIRAQVRHEPEGGAA